MQKEERIKSGVSLTSRAHREEEITQKKGKNQGD